MLKGKKILVYGLGKGFEEKKAFLKEYFQIVGYADKNQELVDSYSQEISIVDMWEYIFVTSRKWYKEIKKDIMSNWGVSEAQIISEYDLWKEMFEKGVAHFSIGDSWVDLNVYRKNLYSPAYNIDGVLVKRDLNIYNRYGNPMEVFFLRDKHFAHDPCWGSDYFIWDRFNWGLDIHFYSHDSMKEIMGCPNRKYGLLCESRSIVPQDYIFLEKNRDFCKEFEAIFTYDDRLLDMLPNAKFLPFNAESWCGKNDKRYYEMDLAHKFKVKNISMLVSNKELCEMHILRKEVARKVKKNGWADVFGTFDGGMYVNDVGEALCDYRYSIIIENEISKVYFTEKITSCMAAQTIPIYCGATDIGKFFNADGMIIINRNDLENIEEILKQCTEQLYMEKIPAILENYQRVKKYENIWNCMYENYL